MSLGFELSSDFLTRDQLPTLSVATARSVSNVLKRYLPQHKIEVHQPNDVYVDGKKICGILLESPTPQYGILGIGLNVNNRLADVPSEFLAEVADRQITSMVELIGEETDISRLTEELLSALEFMV